MNRVLCLSFLIMICTLGFADSDTSTINGVVLDRNNARIVGAMIKIENATVSRHVKSDDEGKFRVELPSGEYKITAEHRGFRRFEFSPFRAQQGVCELVNIHMEVDPPKSPLKVN